MVGVTSPPELHNLLIAIQSADQKSLVSQLSLLGQHLQDHNQLHAYLRESPQMMEITGLITNETSPYTSSHSMQLLAKALSHSCPICSMSRSRIICDIIFGPISAIVFKHLSGDDSRMHTRALALCSVLLDHDQGIMILRRLNWSMRIWRQTNIHVATFVIKSLSLHSRYMMVNDGPAGALRAVLSNIAKLNLSDNLLSDLLSPIKSNLRVTASILNSAVVNHLVQLLSGSQPDHHRSDILSSFMEALLSSNAPSHIAVRVALALDVFTSLSQRRLVLNWIADPIQCPKQCLTPYLSSLRCSMEARLSFRFICNATFLEQLIRRLPSDAASLPDVLTKTSLSVALQHSSKLIVTLALRIVLALTDIGSRQAVSIIPDSQVILRSCTNLDDDLHLRCVRGLIRCSVIGRDAPWSLFSANITTGHRLCDFLRVDMLCNSPPTGTPPVQELIRSLQTATDPRVYARLVALLDRQQIQRPDKIIIVPSAKRRKRSRYSSIVHQRFHAFRLMNDVDRSSTISKILSSALSTEDEMFMAFNMTNCPSFADLWASSLPHDCGLFQWLRAIVSSRFPCTILPNPNSSWTLIAVSMSSLSIEDRLSYCLRDDCPISLISRLIPSSIAPELAKLPTVSKFREIQELDRLVLSSLTKRAIKHASSSLLSALKVAYSVDRARFFIVKQDLSSEGLAFPFVDDNVSDICIDGTPEDMIVNWVDDVAKLSSIAKEWAGSVADPKQEQIQELLSSYSGSTSPVDLSRYECIHAADCRTRLTLFGIPFGPNTCRIDDNTPLDLDEWLTSLGSLIRSPSRWDKADPQYIIPSVLAIIEQSSPKLTQRFLDSGIIGFTLGKGLCHPNDGLRACSYSLLAHFYQTTGLISSQAHQGLTLIKDSIVEDESSPDQMPLIPELTAMLWSSMFSVLTSRQATSHPMYNTICSLTSRRAWLPRRQVPDSLQFQSLTAPLPSQINWLLGVLLRGLRTKTDAKIVAKSDLWARIISWHPLLVNRSLFWAVIAAGCRIALCRDSLVHDHSIIPFMHLNYMDDGAIDCIHTLVDQMHMAPLLIRAQAQLLLAHLIPYRHHLTLPIIAKLAHIAQPMQFAPIISPIVLSSLIDLAGDDLLTSIPLSALLHCLGDIGSGHEDQEILRRLLSRILNMNQTISDELLGQIMKIIRNHVIPDPTAVQLFAAISRCRPDHDEQAIDMTLDHLQSYQ
uniref:URB1 C-terminal domain-containing protein n=1 Tax=Spongospora subterranea TaxID=70186 RepID=A0A0H5R5K0_9EUKA|eukprot:CRZ03459.1 hypothetical protein [Spongospora subterranea]